MTADLVSLTEFVELCARTWAEARDHQIRYDLDPSWNLEAVSEIVDVTAGAYARAYPRQVVAATAACFAQVVDLLKGQTKPLTDPAEIQLDAIRRMRLAAAAYTDAQVTYMRSVQESLANGSGYRGDRDDEITVEVAAFEMVSRMFSDLPGGEAAGIEVPAYPASS